MTWQATAHPIPLGHIRPDQRDRLETIQVRDSITVLDHLVTRTPSGSLRRDLPMEGYGLLRKGLAKGVEIQRAWCEISPSDMANIRAQVRSRLLDFLLELRDSLGNPENESKLKESAAAFDATGLFQNAVFGSNTTIIVGNNNRQSVQALNMAGDLEQLAAKMKEVGLPEDEITALGVAIQKDQTANGGQSFEGDTGRWYSGLLARSAKGTLNVGVDVVTTVIAKALVAYMGAPI